tara:strand:- start:9312 stop:9602 length:291 start_codon:yes stop_codon:yes gene_type:complete
MGQAKNRGSYQERVSQAEKGARPEKINCNDCGTDIIEFEAMNTKGMKGITGAFAGECPDCKKTNLGHRWPASGSTGFSGYAKSAIWWGYTYPASTA